MTDAYTDFDLTQPTPLGAAQLSYPLQEYGDVATRIISQEMVQHAYAYAPPSLSAGYAEEALFEVQPVGQFFFIGDTEPVEDNGLARFTRQWSNLPGVLRDFTTETSTIPYVSWFSSGDSGNQSQDFFREVNVMLRSEFFLVDNTLASGALPAVSSLTRSGSTITLTFSSAHGLVTGSLVLIQDAIQIWYNNVYTITVSSPTVVTASIDTTPTSPATGAVSATLVGANGIFAQAGFIPLIRPSNNIVVTDGVTSIQPVAGPITDGNYRYMLKETSLQRWRGNIWQRTASLITSP